MHYHSNTGVDGVLIDDYEQYSYYDYNNYDQFAGEYFDSGIIQLFQDAFKIYKILGLLNKR